MGAKYSVRRVLLAALLAGGPMTAMQLSKVTGIENMRIVRATLRMRKQGGIIHVAEWSLLESWYGRLVPVFAHGPGEDAPREVMDKQDRKRASWRKNAVLINARRRMRRSMSHRERGPFHQLVSLAGCDPGATQLKQPGAKKAGKPLKRLVPRGGIEPPTP